VSGIQYQSTRRVAADLAMLRQELASGGPREDAAVDVTRVAPSGSGAILQRLSALEETVAQLARNSDYLMERGQLPLATNKVGDLFAKFTDATAGDRDRLQALRLMRRNGGITDDSLLHALNWAQGATNSDTRDDILSALEGLTNSVLRDPLLSFAVNDSDPSVREQAVDSLRRFAGDPKVETELWKMINDPDEDVRDTAMEAIIEGPKSEARMAALQQRASNPDGPLDERLLAWRALRESNQDAPETLAAFAQIAQTSQDPFERAKLMRAFDDAVDRATSRDSVLLPTLVQGLQDPSPLVREPAANALKDFFADPNAQKWLRWAAENDPDPAVRKEAASAFLNNR
jgi:hypothetical protein